MKKRIVTTTAVFQSGYPAEEAALRLKKLGFEAQDMTLSYWSAAEASPLLSEDYLRWAASLKETADRIGIPYTHAHAPGEAENNPLIPRCIEATAALGAKYLVIHPVWRREDDTVIEDRAEFIRRNAQAIAPWLEMAKAQGVVLLSENLLWGASIDPRIIAELVQEVGSDHFGWCYDTGHANCYGYTPDVLLSCVVPPASLHIQDNHGDLRDEHLIPGEGTVDWDMLVQALRRIGYEGDCVLEAHHESLDAPDEERDAILTRLIRAALPLRDAMEA